jgi:hypothetical protein
MSTKVPPGLARLSIEGMAELVDRAAIEFARGDEIVAGTHDGVEHDHLRGMAGRYRKCGRAALERGDPLFQHSLGRIHDARVDVAEGLQTEQRRCMVDIVEDEGRRLVDRRRARAGGGIGLCACMNRKRVEPWNSLGHVFLQNQCL